MWILVWVMSKDQQTSETGAGAWTSVNPETGEQSEPTRLVTATVNEEEGYQYLTTEMIEGEPQSVSVFVDIPAKWLIHVADAGAEGTFVIPTFKFECELYAGDNIIEFTPKLAGVYEFACKLGKGSIVVLGDNS
jgi:hypothetical protein